LGNEDRDTIWTCSISYAVDRDDDHYSRGNGHYQCGKSNFEGGGVGQFGWLSNCGTGIWSDERTGVVSI